MKNKGFTLPEVAIATALIGITTVSSIGVYANYMGNLKDSALMISSKLEKTKAFAKGSTSNGQYIIEGKNTLPYVVFDEKTVTSMIEGENYGELAQKKDYYDGKSGKGNITVSTSVDGDAIYFTQQGLPVDRNGKRISKAHIYVTKSFLGQQSSYTVNVDCLGNITTVKDKDNSSTDACDNSGLSAEEVYANNNIVDCGEGFSWNESQQICQPNCDSKHVLENNVCVIICGKHEVREHSSISNDICNCETGYERLTEKGECVKSCTADQFRDAKGRCRNKYINEEYMSYHDDMEFPVDTLVHLEDLPEGAKYLEFEMWGAGGGGGGADSGDGARGGGGGYAKGKIQISEDDDIVILVGSKGQHGIESADGTRGDGALAGKYGAGGGGGSTGIRGSSGSGGSGGGSSYIKINDQIIAVAGGGGGGGGGSNRIAGTQANLCSAQASNASAMNGGTCPSDGGGGGGGGGGLPFGGLGGDNGFDHNYANGRGGSGWSARGGCYGMSYVISSAIGGYTENPNKHIPAQYSNPRRKNAGIPGMGRSRSGRQEFDVFLIPAEATNGLVRITITSERKA